MLNLFIASDDAGDKTTSYVRGGSIDGAIIVSHHTSDTFIDRIAAAVPVVYGGRPVRERENAYYVDVDNIQGGRDATAYLIERGYRRIGTITGPLTMPAGIDRLQGFREALAAAGLDEDAVEDGDFTADGAADAMRRILERGEHPDAIFVASDLMARGALSVLAAAGLRVPEDVAIIGFDDSPVATSVTPQLTTMRQPSLAQGERMAERAARPARRRRAAARHDPGDRARRPRQRLTDVSSRSGSGRQDPVAPRGRRSDSVRPSSRTAKPWSRSRSPSAPSASASGSAEIDPPETERRHPRSCSAGVPHVHRHVVVVPAGADEHGLVAESGRLVEAEGVDVEGAGGCDVPHREVHVADGCRILRRRAAARLLAEVLAEERVRVEVEGRHLDLRRASTTTRCARGPSTARCRCPRGR